MRVEDSVLSSLTECSTCRLMIGPMVLSPLSEFYGRKIIYVSSFGMFLVWLIPCAVAPNIGKSQAWNKIHTLKSSQADNYLSATMFVARFFDGLAVSGFAKKES